MTDNKTRYTLRIEPELLEKFGYVAEYDGRTKNGELIWMIRRLVAQFEENTGKSNFDVRIGLHQQAQRSPFVIARSESPRPVAIRSLIAGLLGGRIATPVCGLVRNDRKAESSRYP